MHVAITFKAASTTTALEIPAWGPGSYVYNRAAEGVSNVRSTSGAVTNPSRGKWSVATTAGAETTVSYDLPLNIFAGAAHLSGPALYMYLPDRKREACKLVVDLPANWKIACGLDTDGSANVFTAPTGYDLLADNPITMGDFIEDTYNIAGRPHTIVLYGVAKATVDRPFLKKACAEISRMETSLFGGAPYRKYVWHFRVNEGADGGGGLEHLSSTEITLSSGMGPGLVGVMAHEFFHLWNVKRIRSKALGPFDYTQLPQTGALWWLEGVTDYYAHVLLRRNNWNDDAIYFDELARQARSLRNAPDRFKVSSYDSSYRVRDTNNGRGNSQGFGFSYYDAGHQLGFIFDIALLERTDGKYSLDDVELALWNMCKDNQPGFEEGEIRRQLVRFGDLELGELYDKIVMSPGELPMEEYLGKVGMTLAQKPVTTYVPRIVTSARAARKGMVVVSETGGDSGVKADDVIFEVNGVRVDFGTTHEIIDAWKKGIKGATDATMFSIKFIRDGKPMVGKLGFRKVMTTRYVIESKPNPTEAELRLRRLWLAAKRK